MSTRYLLVALSSFFFMVSTQAQSFKERLTLEEKVFKTKSGKKIKADVGTLKVPENRANPNSAQIEVKFVRLKSTNLNAKAPLIYLEGGPGSSCTWQAENPYFLERWSKFLELGDVILLDQRGTGAGRNRVMYIWQKPIPDNIWADMSVADEHFNKVAKDALAHFKKNKVDLTGYTSVENAKDVDELRQALGYAKISLMGFSYGTHLGQTYIKYFGKNVANAILVGVEGLNHTYKLPATMDVQFKKIALLSDADPNIRKEVPNLMALYKQVIQKLEKNPAEVTIRSPLTRKPMKLKVGAFGLNMLLRFDIGDASDIPVFPRLLYTINQGDYSLLRWFLQKRAGMFYGVQGMSITMDKASGVSPDRVALISAQKKTSLFGDVVNPRLDRNWPAPDLGPSFRAPLSTNVRTLFMSGTLDFNTPPHQAEEVRWGFANSSHIIVDYAGHEQILTHPKALETTLRFLKGENVDDVAMAYPRLQFIPVKGKPGKIKHPSIK
ncbi:MAG TPA: hypothetical protein DCS93_03080 [Microscillaceae bacterium]|nr:hypothetical protein [Microscillaceae bacterium]